MITEKEKQYIMERRAAGESFAGIGRSLGHSEDAVRLAFNRCLNRGAGKPRMPAGRADTRACKYCGNEFSVTPKNAKRIFCSDRCRNAWCNEKKRRTPYRRVCESCGKEFIAFGNPHRRFCSRHCFADSARTRDAAAMQKEVLHV